MLINFCYSGLTQTVSSNVVSCEGFECTNLISPIINLRNKGFLAESFIKPPVFLTFLFVCEVEIDHIVVLSTVGSQKSIGIELLSAINSECLLFKFIGSGLVKHLENGFVFHKHGNQIMHKLPEKYRTLSFHTFNKSCTTRAIQVKIFKTFNSSIPALGKIEIWGRTSRNCPQNIVDSVNKTWNEIQKKQLSKSYFSANNQTLDSNSGRPTDVLSSASNKKNEFGCMVSYKIDEDTKCSSQHLNQLVPEEFMDPITCEIMVLPIILPCGKIIDSSTLEKHIEAESKWGRGASDPFTGKLITESNKSVFATDLKLRIDKFLCDHSNEAAFKSLPRTVGRKDIYNRSTETSSNKKSDLDFQKQIVIPSENIPQTTLNIASNIFNQNKRKFSLGKETDLITTGLSSRNLTGNAVNIGSDLSRPMGIPVLSSNIGQSGIHVVSEKTNSNNYQTSVVRNLSYEEESDFALEHSLKRTLSSLPSYTSAKVLFTDNTRCKKCCSEEHLFQLPCFHFLCRTCLLIVTKSKVLKCVHCQSEFKTSDPRRFHL